VKTDPFIIRYADGTYSYNCFHIAPKLNSGVYPQSLIEEWDWTGVNINEESMDKSRNTNSIQYKAFNPYSTKHLKNLKPSMISFLTMMLVVKLRI